MGKNLIIEMDKINRSILCELQINSRIPTVEIGRRVGLSAPAVAERIARMEEKGIIKGYKAVVDHQQLGMSVYGFILFRARFLENSEIIALVDSLKDVHEWYNITGDACMLLKFAVPSTRDLELLIEKLQANGDTTTSIILSEKK